MYEHKAKHLQLYKKAGNKNFINPFLPAEFIPLPVGIRVWKRKSLISIFHINQGNIVYSLEDRQSLAVSTSCEDRAK